MLLEFTVENYGSIKDEVTFSLVAEPSRSKGFNVFTIALAKDDEIRLLKTAAIFGPNASGKSTVLRVLSVLLQLLQFPPKAGQPITDYDPFLLDDVSRSSPTCITVTFIGPESIKYHYSFAFDRERIVEERLEYYPEGRKRSCYERTGKEKVKSDLYHTAKLGKSLGGKEIRVFKNQLLLSKFGEDEPHDLLSPIYLYFSKYFLVDPRDNRMIETYKQQVVKSLVAMPSLQEHLNRFIHAADLGIAEILLEELPENDIEPTDQFPMVREPRYGYKRRYEVLASHIYASANGKPVQVSWPLWKESAGVQHAFALGGIIFDHLQRGGILFIDELDGSLHPILSRKLIELFQSEETNPKNAQLIFTTHDTNLMDRYSLRKDQIWFTDKREDGVTDLYSLQDFEGVREDTAFEKWYLAGKFKALPRIPSLSNIVGNEQED